MPRLIQLTLFGADPEYRQVQVNPDHISTLSTKSVRDYTQARPRLTIYTSIGLLNGYLNVTESVAHVVALIEGSEFYQCDHCDYETDSEGAIARHYDTHPDTEEV
jgi:hypothetical protein